MFSKILEGSLAKGFFVLVLKTIPEFCFKFLMTISSIVLAVVFLPVAKKADAFFSRVGKRVLARSTKVESDVIMFVTDEKEFTCNAKYITEELLTRNLPYRLIWSMGSATRGPFPQGVELVESGTADYFKALAKAKVVIQNGHVLQHQRVAKNPEQFWLQTWHGSLGFKKLEGAGGMQSLFEKLRKLDMKQTDFVITNSDFESDVFNGTYWTNVPQLRLGHARNDVLFNASTETTKDLRAKVLSSLRIQDTGQKFLLFGPTHDDKNLDQPFLNLDFNALRETLSQKFGGTWEFLLRTHVRNNATSASWLSGSPEFCIDASLYPDIRDLMVISDVALTDYSSWICDYIITQKPSFLVGGNLAQYEKSRGFYHDFKDTPFSLATSNEELQRHILAFDQAEYNRRIEDFFSRCGLMDDGHSSERIADLVVDLMGRQKLSKR